MFAALLVDNNLREHVEIIPFQQASIKQTIDVYNVKVKVGRIRDENVIFFYENDIRFFCKQDRNRYK